MIRKKAKVPQSHAGRNGFRQREKYQRGLGTGCTPFPILQAAPTSHPGNNSACVKTVCASRSFLEEGMAEAKSPQWDPGWPGSGGGAGALSVA